MIPDLWSSRGESTTSETGFYNGNMQKRLARGTTLDDLEGHYALCFKTHVFWSPRNVVGTLTNKANILFSI